MRREMRDLYFFRMYRIPKPLPFPKKNAGMRLNPKRNLRSNNHSWKDVFAYPSDAEGRRSLEKNKPPELG